MEHISEAELRVDTAHLDCLQASLAVAAHRLCGVVGEDLLGAETRFRPRVAHDRFDRDNTGLPTVEPTLAEQLARAQRVLGLRCGPTVEYDGGAELLSVARPEPMFVVGDAYVLPWVPYYGHRHTGHGFLLRVVGDRYELTDAYTNRTPWGDAEPRVWALDRSEATAWLGQERLIGSRLVRALGGPTPSTTPTLLAESVADLRTATSDGRIATYVVAYRDHPDRTAALERLVLQTWLLSRQRATLARLTDGTALCAAAERRRGAWRELAEQTYIAMRRAARGRPAPTTVFDDLEQLLRDDADALDGLIIEEAVHV